MIWKFSWHQWQRHQISPAQAHMWSSSNKASGTEQNLAASVFWLLWPNCTLVVAKIARAYGSPVVWIFNPSWHGVLSCSIIISPGASAKFSARFWDHWELRDLYEAASTHESPSTGTVVPVAGYHSMDPTHKGKGMRVWWDIGWKVSFIYLSLQMLGAW